jgi:hypothetical protein
VGLRLTFAASRVGRQTCIFINRSVCYQDQHSEIMNSNLLFSIQQEAGFVSLEVSVDKQEETESIAGGWEIQQWSKPAVFERER